MGRPTTPKSSTLHLAHLIVMRHFFPSFRRGIAAFMALSILVSTVAMAAYLCPKLPLTPSVEMMAMDDPCAGADMEKPVHCASDQSAAKLALEHLASAPTITPPAIISVLTVARPPFSSAITAALDMHHVLGAGPPYLRTQRLRI